MVAGDSCGAVQSQSHCPGFKSHRRTELSHNRIATAAPGAGMPTPPVPHGQPTLFWGITQKGQNSLFWGNFKFYFGLFWVLPLIVYKTIENHSFNAFLTFYHIILIILLSQKQRQRRKEDAITYYNLRISSNCLQRSWPCKLKYVRLSLPLSFILFNNENYKLVILLEVVSHEVDPTHSTKFIQYIYCLSFVLTPYKMGTN